MIHTPQTAKQHTNDPHYSNSHLTCASSPMGASRNPRHLFGCVDRVGTSDALVYGARAVFAGVSPLVAGLIADAVGVRQVCLLASAIAVATSLFALVTL